ncbi:hypothetical protein KPH14_012447 [Odynerus spinipes]|uniref:C2H2-type domain-containing protein n=1 Tax=Odynerus spinipes TaxID=1348599 RepID=A0AAD9RI98_9HYME|nr:hypothetical protein KPH14_012447 [Odynerus spinipes]
MLKVYITIFGTETAHLYPYDEEPYDQRDENYESSDEDKQYYCEVCDKEFPSDDILSQHISTHKLCGIDGCTFSAHPLLVEKHISMQHSTGLYQRMKNLSTPEDIQKWIEERKRRYPTKANIEAKKAAELEKIQRGEMIKQEQGTIRAATNKTSSHREKKRKIRKRQPKRNQNMSPVSEVYRGLISFPGTSCLQDDNSSVNSNEENLEIECASNDEFAENKFNISDEEEVSNKSHPVTNTQTFRLVADYGSDSENDESPEEVPIKKVKTCIDQNEITKEKITNSEQSTNDNICSPTKNNDHCTISSNIMSNNVVSNTSKKLRDVEKNIETCSDLYNTKEMSFVNV